MDMQIDPAGDKPAHIRRLNQPIDAFSEIFDHCQDATARGPLDGLTFAVKEVIDQGGRQTSWGSDLLLDRVPERTATVVARVAAAGAVCVGTTRSTVLAIAGESRTRNPWDLTRSPGGSSSGSAAAVAAGLVDFAIGTQTVGSVIRPASYCGVIGFKPTFDHVPTDGVLTLSPHLDHVGFLARDVETAEAVYDLFAAEAAPQGPVSRILVPHLWFGEKVADAVVEGVSLAVRTLSGMGFRIRMIDLPHQAIKQEQAVLAGLLARGIYDHHRDFVRANQDRLPAELPELVERGSAIDDGSLRHLLRNRDEIRAIMDTAVAKGEFLLMPSTIDLPPLLGCGTGQREPQRLWTLIGWPAINVPVGCAGPLPLGVQLVGKWGSDRTLLSLARNLAISCPMPKALSALTGALK